VDLTVSLMYLVMFTATVIVYGGIVVHVSGCAVLVRHALLCRPCCYAELLVFSRKQSVLDYKTYVHM